LRLASEAGSNGIGSPAKVERGKIIYKKQKIVSIIKSRNEKDETELEGWRSDERVYGETKITNAGHEIRGETANGGRWCGELKMTHRSSSVPSQLCESHPYKLA
jgi:hypothetical protein